jgi:hypothetical protein
MAALDFTRLLVTGDRDWVARGLIWNVLDEIRSGRSMTIIEGGARGADKAAADWARGNHNLGVDLEEYTPQWQRYGKAAGAIRNRIMLQKQPTFVLGFHDHIHESKGTADMIIITADFGLPYAVMTEADCRHFLNREPIVCDRCHIPILDAQPPNGDNFTAGYYTRAGWERFMDPGEQNVCDRCMWADPRYIEIHGRHQ